VEYIDKEVVTTLIKMGTPLISPFKIKEKTPTSGKTGYTSRSIRTISQTTPKMITPISSTIVDLEENPIPTKIPSRSQEEEKATTPPTYPIMQFTLFKLEAPRDEALKRRG
jgi:hypothetical protein